MSYASELPLEVKILTRACPTPTPPTPVILDLVAEGRGSPRLACGLQNSHQLLSLGGCSSYDRHAAVGSVWIISQEPYELLESLASQTEKLRHREVE